MSAPPALELRIVRLHRVHSHPVGDPVCRVAVLLRHTGVQVRRLHFFVDLSELFVELVFERRILDLLHRIQVDRVIVSAEFFSLEELNGGLVELQDNDLVEEGEALDLTLISLNRVSQLRDLVHFALLGPEERHESLLAILQGA